LLGPRRRILANHRLPCGLVPEGFSPLMGPRKPGRPHRRQLGEFIAWHVTPESLASVKAHHAAEDPRRNSVLVGGRPELELFFPSTRPGPAIRVASKEGRSADVGEDE
jgi:hypothetical protein